MAEQPNEQPDVVESTVVEPEKSDNADATTITEAESTSVVVSDSHDEAGYVIPRGAIAFGILMIIGYAFYFFMIWSEVIARGGQ